MALTWHNQSAEELEAQEGRTYYFRASEYRLDESRQWIEAAPSAIWKRFSPASFYRPSGGTGDSEGPHMELLNLARAPLEDRRDEKLVDFANKYGLIGTFHQLYSAPTLPSGKLWVAPDAKITKEGKLEELNPEKNGFDLLEKLLRRQESVSKDWRLARELVAMPQDLTFFPTRELLPADRPDASGRTYDPRPEPWEKVKGTFGARMIIDEHTPTHAAVLCTREHASSALFALPNERIFQAMVADPKRWANYLNKGLVGVSPYLAFDVDGRMERSWRCPSLIQAIYLMFYLDYTGNSTIRKCASRDCANYFRSDNPKRKYCSIKPCANRASTRLSRGQEP
jgi:CGNR zinc finger